MSRPSSVIPTASVVARAHRQLTEHGLSVNATPERETKYVLSVPSGGVLAYISDRNISRNLSPIDKYNFAVFAGVMFSRNFSLHIVSDFKVDGWIMSVMHFIKPSPHNYKFDNA